MTSIYLDSHTDLEFSLAVTKDLTIESSSFNNEFSVNYVRILLVEIYLHYSTSSSQLPAYQITCLLPTLFFYEGNTRKLFTANIVFDR